MIDIASIQLPPSTPVMEAMRVIDRGAAQIALVVDDQMRLLGTLTDGDIRRGLLKGVTLDAPVDRLMKRKFHFLRSGHNHEDALQVMHQKSLRQIPVLDSLGRVVELFLLNELLAPTELSNSVVIMAGGKGTRLRPHTENCPKPMLLIDNKPMLEILLEQCIASGFRSFYFSVNYLKEQIIDYFKRGEKWGVSINYLEEDVPLGTAGSLQLLPESVQTPFLVMNGDVLSRLDQLHLLNFHREHNALATMCVREHEVNVPFGVVQVDGVELAGFVEKPRYVHLVNAGMYVIDPQLLKLLPPKQYTDMPTLLENAQKAGHSVAVCPIHEFWLDVGRPETLQEAHETWQIGDSKP